MKRIMKTLITLLSAISLFACNRGGAAEGARSFILTATVTELGDKILVDVTEGEYASGPYLIIVSRETEISNSEGKKVTRDAIKLGSILEITYSGQVMMSYPAQIAARKIVIKN